MQKKVRKSNKKIGKDYRNKKKINRINKEHREKLKVARRRGKIAA